MGATALLEVDFQGWIVDLAHDRTVTKRARATRDHWRAQGASVFCLRYLDAGDGPRADPTSRDVAFDPALAPEPGDIVLSKATRDAFDNPDLHANLQLRAVRNVVIDGLLTDHGVFVTAISAHRLGYDVTVVGDACASSTLRDHDRALAAMRAEGIRVAPAARRSTVGASTDGSRPLRRCCRE